MAIAAGCDPITIRVILTLFNRSGGVNGDFLINFVPCLLFFKSPCGLKRYNVKTKTSIHEKIHVSLGGCPDFALRSFMRL